MRTAILLVIAAATACTPEVLPGTYLCGPNKACPEGQECSDADNVCVLPGLVEPFACVPEFQTEPDNTPETAYGIRIPGCQSTLQISIDGCLPADDSEDWYELPVECNLTGADITVTFPVAFARVGLELVDRGTGTTVAVDEACDVDVKNGDSARCFSTPLTPGTTYALRVAPSGDDDCDGDCVFNSYVVRLNLEFRP